MIARMPMKRRYWTWTLAGLLAFYASACTPDAADEDTTSTIVTITTFQGAAAAQNATPSDELFSDVCDNSGAPPPGCTALNDFGVVTMIARRKDLLRDASSFGNVVFERYRVTFTRADGRNVPGIDVPFPFDGVLTFEVPVDGGEVTRVFTIVRQQAKLEPPLRNLAFNGGAIVVSTLAQVDFFGHDVAGREITVRGFLNITFGDF